MEHRHFVSHADGAAQLGFDGLLLVIEIGDEDEQATAGEQIDRPAQRTRARGRPGRLHSRERREYRPEVRLADAARHVLPDRLVVDREADGIALARDQIRERCGGHARVVELCHARLAAKRHRLARVHNHLGDKVGRLAVLLRVEAIGAGEQLPVDVLQIVAGPVVPILAELGAVAVETGCRGARTASRRP